MTKREAPVRYSLDELLKVVDATKGDSWRVREHKRSLTIYSRKGYVIHPDLGYVNDEADALFMATFDPPLVRDLLERLRRLEAAHPEDV